jgi:cell division protein FtsW
VLVITLLLLFAVLVPGFGIVVDGSRRWLGYGSLRFQPSEIAKFALLLFGADVLTRRADAMHDARAWTPVLVVGGLLCGLVVLEPDLDSTVVFGLIAFSMLVVGGARPKHLASLAAAGVALSALLAVAVPYRRARVLAFLHPWSDSSNTGYQIAQSLMALGSGGVDGVGLGAGRAKWMFLPNAHTDFIFAIIGEETGLIGALTVIGLFIVLALAGWLVASRAPDRFGRMVAAGLTSWLSFQALVNIGGVLGVMPITGIALPFVSFGSTALIASMAAIGILVNIAQAGVQART